jgi:hypothetical protein
MVLHGEEENHAKKEVLKFRYKVRFTCFPYFLTLYFDPYIYFPFVLCIFFLRLTQYNADTHNTHAHPTPMSTSEGLSTGRSGDSRSHHWRLVDIVVDGNVAYHLSV